MRDGSAMRAMLRLCVLLLLALAAAGALAARPPALPGAGEGSAAVRRAARDGTTAVAGPETGDTVAAPKRDSPDKSRRSSDGSRHGRPTKPTRKKLVDTSLPEFRAHGYMSFPEDASGKGHAGTGALVGERLVVTALHGHLNRPGTRFYPAYDADAPGEYATIIEWRTAPARVRENLPFEGRLYDARAECHKSNDDWVIGLLDKPLGKTYRHLEMPRSYDEIPFGRRIFRYAGYPGHKKLEGQKNVLAWDGTSEVCDWAGFRGPLESDVEPEFGYSGGPLMWRRRSDGLMYVAGLMSGDGRRTTWSRKYKWLGPFSPVEGIRIQRSVYAGGPDFFKTFWEMKDKYEP